MIIPGSFKDKKIVVLGLGRSGLSTVKACEKAGAHVLAWDDQESARNKAQQQGVTLTDLTTIDWKEVDHFILSPGIPHHYPTPHPLVVCAKEAGISPISDIDVLCISQPQARYIAITGTNGKSTTTSLIGHILKEKGVPIEVGGNIGIPALDLMPLQEDGTYVLELSSYQLETSPHLHAHIGVLLNITPDHLDRHGGMDGYVKAKRGIYRNTTSEDTLVISVDDPYCLTIYETLKKTKPLKLLPISLTQLLPMGISVQDGILYENMNPIADLKGFERLKGTHNWQNIAAAYGALRTHGLTPFEIINSIASFPGLAHRQQTVARYKNVLFINDSKATNAEATEKALTTYQGVPLYLLLGGVSKEGGITSLKPYFPSITHAFLYGEAAAEFAHTLTEHVPYTCCHTLEDATRKAAALAFSRHHAEAVILLSPACASFDQFRDFEERGEAFCSYAAEVIEEASCEERSDEAT